MRSRLLLAVVFALALRPWLMAGADDERPRDPLALPYTYRDAWNALLMSIDQIEQIPSYHITSDDPNNGAPGRVTSHDAETIARMAREGMQRGPGGNPPAATPAGIPEAPEPPDLPPSGPPRLASATPAPATPQSDPDHKPTATAKPTQTTPTPVLADLPRSSPPRLSRPATPPPGVEPPEPEPSAPPLG